jgi:hypothetical protein
MSKTLFNRADRDEHFSSVIGLLPSWSPFKQQALKCGRTDYWSGNTYYCRTYGCPCCRALEIKRRKKKLKSRYSNARRGDLLSVTICFEVCSNLNDVRDEWIRFRKQLNYLIAKMRKGSTRWLSFDLSGALEVMPFTLDEIPLMGSDQQEMLAAICRTRPDYEGAPLWLPHIHAIVHAPDVDWQEVRDLLQDGWPHPFQIKVEPFYETREKEKSIETLAGYQLKYEPGRLLGNTLFRWPVEWMVELYEWAYSFSRSYQSFKFSIGAKKRKTALETLRSMQENSTRDSFSISHALYTDSGETETTVDLPLDHAAPSSAYLRWEMEDWCRNQCASEWRRQWVTSRDIARFHFADDVDATKFTLRFSDLLSGPP